ncbi:MAG: gliding motility-associated C-terminal protein [Flavipsychrobacter sp.]|nr:gliding motility-associated C-terminal protein [Flavipsychrobacter sp.]
MQNPLSLSAILTSMRAFTRLLLLILLFPGSTFASHIVGLDLFYKHVSGNTYTITLIAYADCGPASASAFATLPTASPTVCIYDGGTSVGTVTLMVEAPATGVEITPVCPKDTANTQCTNPSNPIPGIKKFVYSANYTLPYTSAVWRFIFTGDLSGGSALAGRAAAITNLMGATTSQLVDTLNNTTSDNSSPVLTSVPVPFFCLNNNDTYNPGAVDPDGDNLVFDLVDGISGSANCSPPNLPVTYIAGRSGADPLIYNPGSFTFDRTTGQIDFYPNVIQRALVVYNIQEFRGGNFVGSCQREMTFLIIPCTVTPPTGTLNGATAGFITDDTHFKICKDSGDFSLYVNPTSPDTNNNVTVTATGLPAGSAFHVINNGTKHPRCVLSWTSNGIPPGVYVYYLTYKDDACPLSGSQTQAFTISIMPVPDVKATGDVTSCLSGMGIMKAEGAVRYIWEPATGLGCPTCANTTAVMPKTTLYTVIGIDEFGCVGTDTASLIVYPDPPGALLYGITASQSIPYGSSIQLDVKGAWIYNWTPSGTLTNNNINNPIASPREKTTYTVYGYSKTGCPDSANVTIDVITTSEDVPTAFTPNGDGINDVFCVTNLAWGRLVELSVYNRWGQRVFTTTDNTKGWDGTFNGIQQDMGVYHYYITVEREDKTPVHHKGDVTLIR